MCLDSSPPISSTPNRRTCSCWLQSNEDGAAAEAEEPADAAPVFAPKKQMRSEDPEFQNQQQERYATFILSVCRIEVACFGIRTRLQGRTLLGVAWKHKELDNSLLSC